MAPNNNNRRSRFMLTPCAGVSRKWRAFFEPLNFHQLILTPDSIHELNERISEATRLHVRRVWLRIELAKYACAACRSHVTVDDVTTGSRTTVPAPFGHLARFMQGLSIGILDMNKLTEQWNQTTFEEAIVHLFKVMSTWDSSAHQGITLELSFHSPTDSMHFFKNRTFQEFEWTEEDVLPLDEPRREFLARRPVRGNNVAHYWRNGRHDIPGNLANRYLSSFVMAKRNLLGTPFELFHWQRLVTVPVISAFMMRRQYHRQLSPMTFSYISRALPSLEQICCEIWSRYSIAEPRPQNRVVALAQDSLDRESRGELKIEVPAVA